MSAPPKHRPDRQPSPPSPDPAVPLLALDRVSRVFARQPDMAERLLAAVGLVGPPPQVRAVEEVSLAVAPGEVLGLVGESGCGKSTLARMIAGIHGPSAGRLLWRGQDVARLDEAGRRAFLLACQIVFQDPSSALNPRQRVGELIAEAPRVHRLWPAAETEDRIVAVMRQVGLDPALRNRLPHQVSGGQRQRVAIARALAVGPQLLVCDEAVAALDVSVQAQVLNLFLELRAALGLTYVFISHDIGVIRHMADRVAVMYLGRIVESAPAPAFFAAPHHPYSRALLQQVPRLDQRRQRFAPIAGEIPSPLAPPPGCRFHTRCPLAEARCRTEPPPLRPAGADRLVACHLAPS